MTTEAHRRLARRLNQPPTPLKNLESDVLYEILDILFSEEEAEVVSNFPRMPSTADKVARKLHRPVTEIEPILEGLAERAVIFSYGEGDGKKYFVFPIFPGVYEMQFWKRPDGEDTTRLARLYDQLYDEEFARYLMGRHSRVFRIIPIEEGLGTVKTGVLPSDSLREVVDRHQAWALANHCACRRQRNLIGDGCDKPSDVCMSFGAAAHYIDKKGFGRLVSKQEALEAVDRAEEAGLVHFCDNVELPVIACNCCACCCVSMANLTHYNTPAMFADSRFVPERDEDKCNSCGACAKHCFSGAFRVYDRKVVFEKTRCIGCGVCVAKCKQGALKLAPKPLALPVPENYGQMFVNIGNEWTGMERPGDRRALKVNRTVGNVMQWMMKKMA